MSTHKNCPFCGVRLQAKGTALAAKTDEHIIPQWLMDHLGLRRTPITSRRRGEVAGTLVAYCRRPISRFVNGRVCAQCNNGWMAQLERQAKPILPRLITDPTQLAHLREEERHILALWTLKTAAALNRTPHRDLKQPQDSLVPDEHIRNLASGILPDDVLVVAAGCPANRPADFLENATWAIPSNSIPLQLADLARSYKICFSFQNLFLAVAYYPNPEYRYVLIKGKYAILWGSTQRVILNLDPEGVGLVPAMADLPLLEGFLGNVHLVSKTWWDLTHHEDVQMVIPYGQIIQPSRK